MSRWSIFALFVLFVMVVLVATAGFTALHCKNTYCKNVGQTELSRGFREELMDVVYTWVDGSDPVFKARRARAKGLESSISNGNGANRYLENGELEYSIKATLRHCDTFLGDIYVVTPGQVPSWYSAAKFPRVHFVDQADIMPEGTVSFNSNVIEMYLHKIPNIRRWFLYMNDDMFINKPVTKEVFFYADERPRFVSDGLGINPLFATAITARSEPTAASRHWTEKMMARRNPESKGRHHVLYGHAPIVVSRDMYEKMFVELGDEIEKARTHVFRQPDDLVLVAFYYPSLMVDRGLAKFGNNYPSKYIFVNNSVTLNKTQMGALGDGEYTFVCLNDSRSDNFENTSRAIREHLHKVYGEY